MTDREQDDYELHAMSGPELPTPDWVRESWQKAADARTPDPITPERAPRIVMIRRRSPGGRWLTVTGELVATCICDRLTSRLVECAVHPSTTEGASE